MNVILNNLMNTIASCLTPFIRDDYKMDIHLYIVNNLLNSLDLKVFVHIFGLGSNSFILLEELENITNVEQLQNFVTSISLNMQEKKYLYETLILNKINESFANSADIVEYRRNNNCCSEDPIIQKSRFFLTNLQNLVSLYNL